MKFTCEKALLQSAISISSRAVSPKSSISALEGILVNATDELRLTGYNLSTGIRTTIPADVTEQGNLVLGLSLIHISLSQCRRSAGEITVTGR